MRKNTLKFDHPCFSNCGCQVARMHLAVAPKCNIKCCFCTPTVSACVHGCTPGVAKRLLSPAQAVDWVRQVREEQGVDIGIVGIAGPGEPLYNPETFETIGLVREAFPHIHVCLSTNGLLLSQSIGQICALGVETLTVTVNAVTPAVGARIYEHVAGQSGEAGAALLLERQWEGIRTAVRHGLVVKINSVFVPGVNDGELVEIARMGEAAGANIQNIIPLIPRDSFAGRDRPDSCALHRAREEAGESLEQFVRCMHCRADAVVTAGGQKTDG